VRIFGPNPTGGPEDIWTLAAQPERETAPAIRIDCGVDAGLIGESRALHAHLTRLGIAFHWRTLGAT
jgi:hypothetical protein